MNEIKHIHIGQQQFTISVEAYGELHEYLEAIKRQSGASGHDIVEEVEARMAELLTERGNTPAKVVLPRDIAFLKEQLGEPRDFKDEEGSETDQLTPRDESPRRLFRDTQHGMIAGVAAGLAAYLSIDVVIIRLLFVALVFAGGSGILLYVVLWLIMPEARTGSDRLQMRGQAVTVETLKGIVDRADVPGAARRVHSSLGRIIEVAAKFILSAAGLGLALVASVGLLSLLSLAMYLVIHRASLAGEVFFPLGINEIWIVILTAASAVILLLFLLLLGVAMVRRRWQLPAWCVAALFGLFFITAPIAGALTASSAPVLHARFDALHHYEKQALPAFNTVDLSGSGATFNYFPDTRYSIQYRYLGATDIHRIKAQVTNGILTVDAADVATRPLCPNVSACLLHNSDLQIDIHAPQLTEARINGTRTFFLAAGRWQQDALTLRLVPSATASIQGVMTSAINVNEDASGNRVVQLTGLQQSQASGAEFDISDGGYITINRTEALTVQTAQNCNYGSTYIAAPAVSGPITVNAKTVANAADYAALQSTTGSSPYNCVSVSADDTSQSSVEPQDPSFPNVP